MPYVTTGLGRLRLQVFSGLGGFQESLTWKTCLQRQQCLGIQGIIWLSQSSLTQHHQLMILRRRMFICTWMHPSTSYTKIVVVESGFWACIYIFDSNRSSMVINLRGLNKYESNHTGDGKADGQKRTEVRTGNIYEFLRSNVVTRGVTERQTLITQVSRNVGN